jgi:hypothetical protein
MGALPSFSAPVFSFVPGALCKIAQQVGPNENPAPPDLEPWKLAIASHFLHSRSRAVQQLGTVFCIDRVCHLFSINKNPAQWRGS